jgi:hypothetical protein
MFVAAGICSMGWEGSATCAAQGEGESAASLPILPAWVFDTANTFANRFLCRSGVEDIGVFAQTLEGSVLERDCVLELALA